MNLSHLYDIDFVAEPIRQRLAGRPSKRGRSGSINIDCPICPLRAESGYRADHDGRCGIWLDVGTIGIKCFNCQFKTRFTAGSYIGKNMKDFMMALGIAEREVKMLGLRAAQIHKLLANDPVAQSTVPGLSLAPSFPAHALPPGAKTIDEWSKMGCEDSHFIDVCAYLLSRGDYLSRVPTYYWTPHPGKHHLNRRLIIPYMHEGRIAGWTGRSIHKTIEPKYHNDFPSGLLFNTRAISEFDRKIVIVVEGIFDALALDAVGVGSNSISPQQAQWLMNSGKKIIVLPDRDRSGKALVDVALQYGWSVAFPHLRGTSSESNWWDAHWDDSQTVPTDFIKDAADAVQRYGRIYTLRSVIESATNNKMRVTQLSEQLFK